MKRIYAFLLATISMVACKKSNDLPAPPATIPTLTKKGADKLVTPPKQKVELTYTIKGGNADDGDSRLSFAIDQSSTVPLSFLSNYAIELTADSDSSVMIPATAISIQTGVIYIPMVKKEKTYTLHIYFNVSAGAIGTLVMQVKLASGLTDNTGFVKSIVVTFGNPTLVVTSDPNTPDTSKAILAGTDVELVRFFTKAIGQQMTAHNVPITISLPNAVSGVSVYDSMGTFLGNSSSFTGGTATVDINLTHAQDAQMCLVVKAQLKPITSASQSNVSVRASIGTITYTTLTGDTRSVAANITGNDMQIFKSLYSVSSPGGSTTLQNGVQNNLNTATVTSTGSSSATKTISWDIGLVDNAPFVDTLKIKSLGIKINGTPLAAGSYYFTNQSGVIIDSLTQADTKLYLTYVSETVTPAGGTTTFTLTGVPTGYVHTGDVFKSKLSLNDAQSAFRYVNAGIPSGVLAKLGDVQAASSSAILCNMVISDNAAGISHSPSFGGSTADWTNSRWVVGASEWYVLTR